MNISQYNQALNQAMPWTAKLYETPKKNPDLIDTKTEYGEVKVTNKKGSHIL